ncbi:major facilitator superfamily domain-containing protein [Ilyonectria sp. MPI-CAGE-AT-0026]|nr:major facilitator superfamily domain-containing protein [Ilyonectria sp. MPI-CAGE-AT-0026]KAH6961783.1 major facilitator superfamily domain-containing protein [Ilyonectria sp. MPI-CAGE-AT-0026]
MASEATPPEKSPNSIEHYENVEQAVHLDRVPTVEVDTYQGLTLTCVIVYLAILAVGFAEMMVIISSGSLARIMVADIGGTDKVQWISQSVPIVNLALGAPVAQAADYWGRKWFLVISCAFAVVGSIIVSRATNIDMALAGNALASISTSAQPLLFAVASEILPRRWRPAAQGGVTGIFAINFTSREKLKKLDWVGIIMLPVAVTILCIGLTWSQNPFSWKNAHVLAPFVVGFVLVICLALYEGLIKKDVSVVFERDSVLVSLNFAIVFIGAIVSSIIASIYCSWSRQLRWPLVISYVGFVLFYATMMSVGFGDYTNIWGFNVFLGLGFGGCLTCIVVAAQFSAPPELLAISSGALITARAGGAAICFAIGNAIFNSQIGNNLPKDIASAVLPLGLPPQSLGPFIEALANHNDHALATIEGVTPQIIQAGVHGLRQAYITSLRPLHGFGLALSVIAVIASVFIIDPKRDFTMAVDAPLDAPKEPQEKRVAA